MTTELKDNPTKAREFFAQKMDFTTGPIELNRKIQEKANIVIIDVRAAEDYTSGHIPGAINLAKEKWNALEGLSKEKLNVVYCYSQTCHLAAKAAVEFASQGIRLWKWMADLRPGRKVI